MSAAHTEGRVTFKEDGDANHYSMLTEDGKWWLAVLANGEQTSVRQVANMRRLAACWNACDGISTDVLEKGRVSPDAFQIEESRADMAERQCEDLLKALKLAHHMLTRDYIDDAKMLVIDKVDAAIAKATGEVS